jgi:hypothetical protein
MERSNGFFRRGGVVVFIQMVSTNWLTVKVFESLNANLSLSIGIGAYLCREWK